MDKCIYEMKIVQADKGWFKVRRYPRFDTTVSYQILYYNMDEITSYIKTAVEHEVFQDLICFMVYEHSMNMVGEGKLTIYGSDGIEAHNMTYRVGDIVDIFMEDDIILGLISEITENGYVVITKNNPINLCVVDKQHVFKPHYRIPTRTEPRLRKLLC